MSRIRKVLLLFVIPACLVLMIPTAAHAAWEGVRKAVVHTGFSGFSGPCVSSPAGPGGPLGPRGCYNRADDRIYINDKNGDGMRTGVQWHTDYTSGGTLRAGLCWWPGDGGIMGDNPGQCDFNFAEGHKIVMRVAVCDGDVYGCGRPGTGSGWKSWSAWVSGPT